METENIDKRSVVYSTSVKWIMLLGIIVICASVFSYSYFRNKTTNNSQNNETVVINKSEPIKNNYGTSTPPEFPADIPVERVSDLSQSYDINYIVEKQNTVVFFSNKTVKENYLSYKNFLEKNNWNISNKYESSNVSSLYATKENNDINVTISDKKEATSTKSQVSISVLKK